MSLTNALQERLNADVPLVDQITHELGMSDDERMVAHLRTLEAKVKNIEAEMDEIKAELKARAIDGERIGSDQVGYYQMQPSKRETFDYKKAMMSGLFNLDQAEPFIKRSDVNTLVYKGPEKK